MNNIYKKVLSFAVIAMVCWVGPAIGAESYDIKEMTPQVLAALEGRSGRYDQLVELKVKGVLGENNKGYVEVLKSEGDAEVIAEAENVDRKIIYQTIAEQNNLDGQLATIEKVFASVKRDKAVSGNMIQMENGKWVSK